MLVCVKISNRENEHGKWACLFGMIYLLISSLGEPTFNNKVSIPIAILMEIMFGRNLFGFQNVDGS